VIVPAIVNDRFDITIVTAAMLVSGAVAALDWDRGRVANHPAALLRCASASQECRDVALMAPDSDFAVDLRKSRSSDRRALRRLKGVVIACRRRASRTAHAHGAGWPVSLP